MNLSQGRGAGCDLVVDPRDLLVRLAHELPAERVQDHAGRHRDGDAEPEEVGRQPVEEPDLCGRGRAVIRHHYVLLV